MIVKYTNSFVKDIKKIKDKKLLNHLKEFIEMVKSKPNIKSIKNIPNIKQLKGHKSYYRLKIKNYRTGMEVKKSMVTFVRFLHRKEIYRYFPIMN